MTSDMRTEFGLPLLRENTDDGWDPAQDQIIDFVGHVGRSMG